MHAQSSVGHLHTHWTDMNLATLCRPHPAGAAQTPAHSCCLCRPHLLCQLLRECCQAILLCCAEILHHLLCAVQLLLQARILLRKQLVVLKHLVRLLLLIVNGGLHALWGREV